MTLPNEPGTVLESDTRGRVRVPGERRDSLLDEFEKSGVSGRQFAQLAGVNYATFRYWVQRRRHARKEPGCGLQATEAVQLLEVVADLRAPGGESALCIELPGGARMTVGSPGQLTMAAELLELLSTRGRSGC